MQLNNKIISDDVKTVLEDAANLDAAVYAIQRKDIQKQLGKDITLSDLDKAVNAIRNKNKLQRKGEELEKEEIEPWHEPVDGSELFNEVRSIIKERVILPDHADIAAALFVMLTYCFNYFDILPMLLIGSPVKRCGKSVLRKVLSKLVYNPQSITSITESSIYRVINDIQPCLLIDEFDRMSKNNDTLIGLINGGHEREAAYKILQVPQGDGFASVKMSTWAPKVLSGIGKPDQTIIDRSICVVLRRKFKEEKIIRTTFKDNFGDLKRKIKRFIDDNIDRVEDDIFLKEINDRAADNWSPLLGIAKLCGCFDAAKKAAIALNCEDDAENTKTGLLQDIRDYFDKYLKDYFWTAELLEWLLSLDERPYQTWNRGREITTQQLGKVIREFGVKSQTIRQGTLTKKGYYKADFSDAFNAYLPTSNETTVTSVTSDTADSNNVDVKNDVTGVTAVTVNQEGMSEGPLQQNNDGSTITPCEEKAATTAPWIEKYDRAKAAMRMKAQQLTKLKEDI